MKIQTCSIVAGSAACNARCPFCVSKMTPLNGITLKQPEFDWDRFDIAASLAIKGGSTTAMLTSKGEPLLFPKQVIDITKRLGSYRGQSGERAFPLIELQTNGIVLADNPESGLLTELARAGMTTIAISVVHHKPEINHPIYLPHRKEYIDLPALIEQIHAVRPRLSVRLAVVMIDGGVDTPEEVADMIAFAGKHHVDQLSFRPVNAPDKSESGDVADWTAKHFLKDSAKRDIEAFVESCGTRVGRLGHGATIFDVDGQNVCLTNSLTLNTDTDELRQLIYFPDGAIRWDWRYPGARML